MRLRSCLLRLGTTGMLAAVLPTFAAGNRGDLPFPPRPTLAIGRTERPPVVDGGIEDPAWSNAACIPVLQDWRTGRPLSPGTRVYACWDSAALYVAWDCREPDMRNIVARTKGDVWQDDDVELFLQRPGRPDYRHLMVNPLGRVQCEASTGKPYAPRVKAGVKREANGWKVEIAVPWSALGGPPEAGEVWRGNFHRVRRPRPAGFGCWAVTGGPFHRPERFGNIRFVRVVPVRVTQTDPGPGAPGWNRAQFAGRAAADVTVSVTGAKVPVSTAVPHGRSWNLRTEYVVDFDSAPFLTFSVRSGTGTLWYSRSFPVMLPGRETLRTLMEACGRAPRSPRLTGEAAEAWQRAAERRTAASRAVLDRARTLLKDATARRRSVPDTQWKEILATADRCARNLTRPAAWTGDPYEIIRPDSLPAEVQETPEVRIEAFRNEYEPGSLRISNLFSGHALELRVRIGPIIRIPEGPGDADADSRLPADHVELYEAVMIRTANGGVRTDPIVPLDAAGRVFVPDGETREIWVLVNAFGVRPGYYRGSLIVQSLDPIRDRWTIRVPVAVRIHPVELARTCRIRVFNFDYYRGATSDVYLRDLLRHRVNVFALRVPVPDGDGRADFHVLDEQIERVRDHGMIFFECWFFRSRGWQRGHARWVRDLAAYMRSKGLKPDRWVLHIFDETLSDLFLDTARHIKRIEPGLPLFSDRMGVPDRLREFAPVVDYWCPHFRDLTKPGFRFMQQSGRPVWTYDCGSGKAVAPSHNRALPWCAWHYGLDGVCYWTYFSNYGDSWNDFDNGHPDWSKVYVGRDGAPVSSKRWEAWREGLEDFALFDLYAGLVKKERRTTPEDARVLGDIHAVGAAADAAPETIERIVGHVRRRVLRLKGLPADPFPPFFEVGWSVRIAGDGRGRVKPLPMTQAAGTATTASLNAPGKSGPDRSPAGFRKDRTGAFLISPTARSWAFLVEQIESAPGEHFLLEFEARGRGRLKAGFCEGFRWGGDGRGHRTTLHFLDLTPEWQRLRIEHVAGVEQPLEALIGFDYGNAGGRAAIRDYRVRKISPPPAPDTEKPGD